MTGLRFLSAGESHGPALSGIIEGMPAGLSLSIEAINQELARRQRGYGRGGRMQIETDKVRVLSGVRFGQTLGSPIGLQIVNRDFENWQSSMAISAPASNGVEAAVTRPRPGHGDLAGMLKYRTGDARNILERASARETAMRVAIGAVARQLLCHFGIKVFSHVIQIGDLVATEIPADWEELEERAENSLVRCADERATEEMVKRIDAAREAGDSLGGIFEVIAWPMPAGLGSHVHWDRRLDGCLAQALMSIPAIKAVEIGLGRESALRPGSQVHDEIFFDKEEPFSKTSEANDEETLRKSSGMSGRRDALLWQGEKWLTAGGFYRKTNRAGGIEAGMTNGEAIMVRAAMKPIPTLSKPLDSVDFDDLRPVAAGIERTDVTAVPAAAVVGEAMVAWVVASAFMEKFGGDSLTEMEVRYREHLLSLCP
jgi:chorismate synthase